MMRKRYICKYVPLYSFRESAAIAVAVYRKYSEGPGKGRDNERRTGRKDWKRAY